MLTKTVDGLIRSAIVLSTPTPTPSPSPAKTSSATAAVISQHTHDVALIIALVLVGLSVGVVIAFIAQGWSNDSKPLLAIPYMTWFILHIVIATLGVLSVIALGLAGVLNASGVSGLLGSLFGYVLGAAKSQGTPSSSSTPPMPTVTGLWPSTGDGAQGVPVGIAGSSLPTTGAAPTVSFGGVPATNVRVVGPGTIYAVAPGHAPGTVDVVVTLPNGAAVGHSLSFTYT